MSGHFTILSSPELIDIQDEIQRRESLNYNQEIKNDCILMYDYLLSCNLLPSPYCTLLNMEFLLLIIIILKFI